MIAKLAKSTAYFFVEKQVVKKEDEEVYAYGMELLYSSIMNIAVAVMISIITNTVFPTSAFLITFIVCITLMILSISDGFYINSMTT